MRISINELLKKRLTNPGFDADSPVARTIRVVATSGDGDCWVEVEHEDGEAFKNDLFNAAYENGVSQVDKARILACAAVLGHVQSMNDLGSCFHFWKGVASNYDLSIYWHTQAADRGDAYAMQNLGQTRCPLKPGEIRNRFGQKMRQIDVDFYHACRTESVEKLKEMLERGANPNAAWYNDIGDDYYPVHQAALNPDFEVLKLVIGAGADPCQNDFWSAQPLAYAVRQGSLEKVQYLIGLGNDPSRVDYDGASVFYNAAANPDVRVLELLLEYGVDKNDGADDMTPLSRALVDSTPERVKWLADHGAWMCDAVEQRAYRTPLENLRAILECGYDPNTFDEDSEDTKVIDHLDPRRQALFEEFGGTVLNRDAEKFYQTYKGEIWHYRRYGVVEFMGKKYSLCEDIWSDNAPTLCLRGMALGVRHDETMDEDGFYPCATLYFTGGDGVHPVEVTEGPSETMRFNPVLCQFKDITDGTFIEV